MAKHKKNDTTQTTLIITANNLKLQKYQEKTKTIIDFNIIKDKKLICPFCLNINTVQNFNKEITEKLYYTKEKIHKNLCICPSCKISMRWKTLFEMLKWDATQFADWVFMYSLNGFWNKIKNFKQWNNRLYEMGFSFDFWKRYKELKGEKQEKFEQDQQPDEYFKERYGNEVELPQEEY